MTTTRPTQMRIFVLALAVAFPLAGCAEEEGPPMLSGGRSAPPPPVDKLEVGKCEEGQSQECSIILGKHNDIVSCFHGIQYCKEGLWGKCEDGTIVDTAELPGIVNTADAGPTP